jgi:hypothetical protein
MKSDSTNSLPKGFERAATQIREEAYEEGYAAAVKDVLRIFKEAERRRTGPRPPKLTTLILQKITEHPEGMSTKEIKNWLISLDDMRFFGKTDSQISRAVRGTLSWMKSKSGLVERKDRKWFRRSDERSARH